MRSTNLGINPRLRNDSSKIHAVLENLNLFCLLGESVELAHRRMKGKWECSSRPKHPCDCLIE